MTRRLRLAIAGTGYFSQFHFESWDRLPVDVVGICSLDKETADERASAYAEACSFDGFTNMLDATEPDLVDIITPPPTHVSFATAAIERGIPVICQKPFTQCLADAKELARLAAQAAVPLIVHENFRFQPWYRKLSSLIAQGAVGDLYSITFNLRPGDGQGPEAYLSRQSYFQKQERFLIRETAIHLFDVFRFLAGDVAIVTAELRRLNPVIAGEDAGTVILVMANGATCLFDGNRLADHPAEDRRLTMGEMAIEGSAGTLTLNGDGMILKRDHGSNDWTTVEYEWQRTGFAGDCVHAFQSHALAHIRDGEIVENSATEYLANLEIEEAVYRSNALGTRIRLGGSEAAATVG